jgi:hypothetical protein
MIISIEKLIAPLETAIGDAQNGPFASLAILEYFLFI